MCPTVFKTDVGGLKTALVGSIPTYLRQKNNADALFFLRAASLMNCQYQYNVKQKPIPERKWSGGFCFTWKRRKKKTVL